MTTDEELDLIIAEDGNEVPTGIWYEIFDYSERDYGSDWGYKIYNNGKVVDEVKGAWSSIRSAGDAARKAKKRYMKGLLK